jgi:hypothetical protein
VFYRSEYKQGVFSVVGSHQISIEDGTNCCVSIIAYVLFVRGVPVVIKIPAHIRQHIYECFPSFPLRSGKIQWLFCKTYELSLATKNPPEVQVVYTFGEQI